MRVCVCVCVCVWCVCVVARNKVNQTNTSEQIRDTLSN